MKKTKAGQDHAARPGEAPSVPGSIAIAGAWGYIGRKFLDAAHDLGIAAYVLDPGPRPEDLAGRDIHILGSEKAFYELDAGVFHLATHPHQREYALSTLFARSASASRPAILCEKPMAPPDEPELCEWIVSQAEASGAFLLFDFPELFDPMTLRIQEFLTQFSTLEYDRILSVRSKDREDPNNPRNYKVMVPIQYQETVHCIAFLLTLLAIPHRGNLHAVCRSVRAEGTAESYTPPNPEAYAGPVDGRFEGALTLNGVRAELHTNFKAGAPWLKTKRIEGKGDGQPFAIEASYLEGAKFLKINGVDQGFAPDSSSYRNVIVQLWNWFTTVPHQRVMAGLYPNPQLASYTYALSQLLWQACATKRPIEQGDPLGA